MQPMRDFAQRHAAVLAERGVSSGEVERRLRDVLGADATVAAATARYPLIDAMSEAAALGEGERQAFRARTIATVLGRGEMFCQAVRAALNVQFYAACLGAVATIIWLIWMAYVAPQLLQLYAETGMVLPALTRWFVHPVSGGAMFVLIWLCIGGLVGTAHGLLRVFRTARRPSPMLRRLPVAGLLLDLYVDWLTAVFAHALLPGSEPGRVLEQLEQWRRQARLEPLIGRRERFGLGQALTAAARLNTLDAEAAWQANRLELELPVQAAKAREWVTMTLLLVFALGIGAMVIGMYLPIFKLAAVI